VKLSKRILKNNGVRAVLCWLAAGLIRIIYLTNRWQIIGGDIPEKFWTDGKPFIICFWHGRIMMMRYIWRDKRPISMLISDHQDGQLIARTITHLGIKSVVGSTSKGGARALREMVKWINAGEYIGITPDGPRGPRMRISDGVIALSRLSGVPIVPVSYSVSRGKNVGSWDRFLIAYPFGRGVFIWGDPIHIGKDDQDQTRLAVENSLNDLTRRADELVGREVIEPAPRAQAGEGGA
jgi:lysophospholipid acyltransferase (LPLAT)-like uncharacterized protein